jgi:hypothetical protein
MCAYIWRVPPLETLRSGRRIYEFPEWWEGAGKDDNVGS